MGMAAVTLDDIRLLLDHGEVEAAFPLLARMVVDMPAYLPAWVLLARAFEQRSQWSEAQKIWAQVAFMAPDAPVVRDGLREARRKMRLASRIAVVPAPVVSAADSGVVPTFSPDLPPPPAPVVPAANLGVAPTFSPDLPPPPAPVVPAPVVSAADSGVVPTFSPDRRPPPVLPNVPEAPLSPKPSQARWERVEEHEAPSLSAPPRFAPPVEPPPPVAPAPVAAEPEAMPSPPAPKSFSALFGGGLRPATPPAIAAELPEKALDDVPHRSAPSLTSAAGRQEDPDAYVDTPPQWNRPAPVMAVPPSSLRPPQMESTPPTQGNGLFDLDNLDDLIDALTTKPRIEPRKDLDAIPPPDLESHVEHVASETLARILAMQKQYSQAAEMYARLAVQHPDRASHFRAEADRLRALAS